jgi:hypothetical protein
MCSATSDSWVIAMDLYVMDPQHMDLQNSAESVLCTACDTSPLMRSVEQLSFRHCNAYDDTQPLHHREPGVTSTGVSLRGMEELYGTGLRLCHAACVEWGDIGRALRAQRYLDNQCVQRGGFVEVITL